MDILGILQNRSEELYPDDLDFFEAELDTNESYTEEYVVQCYGIIRKLRAWMRGDAPQTDVSQTADPPREPNPSGSVFVDVGQLFPESSSSAEAQQTRTQQICAAVQRMRDEDSYKTKFKEYAAQTPEIDAGFVDANYTFFLPWEIGAILSVRQMPEAFLEKYFDALPHDKIARFQQFSESFFMKHYAQLDTNTVLKFGKNAWRKKENRSKQLDVFLRLKGVKI